VRSRRGHRARVAHGGARPVMRFSRRAPGGLQGGVGQDFTDRGLPACLGNGEAATNDSAEEFVGARWAPATIDVLEELLQLEEGEGKLRDHPAREERLIGDW
jgi:hypothetical protein